MQLTGTVGADEALTIYLQDHHAGAQGGLALARRAARNQRGTPAGAVLEGIVRDIEEDEQVLLDVMDRFGAEPSPVKDRGAQLAERVGRLKLNGTVFGNSPLSPVVEVEGLLSGVKSKQHVWTVLRDAVGVPDGIDADRMIERADDQLERLHALWMDLAREAFPPRTP